mmetsp:Transcript_21489/g.28265  ORF Transcript_21489/g.28265 Transcript_21489/m.28265 type:complete len:311 (+) Transcript_21489:112-1044(+)
MSTPALKSCLNILRRTPPDDGQQNLDGLAALLSPNEDAIDELYQRVDAPLKDATDPLADNRPYLLCDHNRDGDSYRSPWSNSYNPALEEADGFKPSNKLRKIEIQFNEVFDTYREHYYGKNAISSVYLWEKEDNGGVDGSSTAATDASSSFAGCFLIKKTIEGDANLRGGFWNSVHIVDVVVSGGNSGSDADGGGNKSNLKTTYKLTTTILISMKPFKKELDQTNISGSLTRQHDKVFSFTADAGQHIANIGKMIEDMEIEMRSNMDSLYIQKTREIVDAIRRPSAVVTEGQKHTMMLNKAIADRGIGMK